MVANSLQNDSINLSDLREQLDLDYEKALNYTFDSDTRLEKLFDFNMSPVEKLVIRYELWNKENQYPRPGFFGDDVVWRLREQIPFLQNHDENIKYGESDLFRYIILRQEISREYYQHNGDLNNILKSTKFKYLVSLKNEDIEP